jgi:hypothetical protein
MDDDGGGQNVLEHQLGIYCCRFVFFLRRMARAFFKLTRAMALLFAMRPHARQYFLPSLRRFGILSAQATTSVIV